MIVKKKKKVSPTDALPFKPSERQIFIFCDRGAQCKCAPGEAKCRRVDPMKVLFTLYAQNASEIESDIKLVSGEIPTPESHLGQQVIPALQRLAETSNKLFGIKEFDEATGLGLTVPEMMNVLFSFFAFYNEVKKKLPSSPTTSASQAPPSTHSPTVTKSPLESGSTAPKPTPMFPQALPAESPSHLAVTSDINSSLISPVPQNRPITSNGNIGASVAQKGE